MGNALTGIIDLPTAEKESRGLVYTPAEIRGQAALWSDAAARVKGSLPAIRPFVRSVKESGSPACVLAGAGTSQFIGFCVEGLFRKNLGFPTNTVSTAALVSTPELLFVPDRTTLMVSFARSGNSPESLGAVHVAGQMSDRVAHLAVTCNPQGALLGAVQEQSNNLAVVLDERTNDGGLAMTASFSNMVVAAQALTWMDRFEEYESHAKRLVTCGEHVLETAPDIIQEVSGLGFTRAVFLGSGCNYGTAVESHLKLQELTAGKVMCAYETFPGLRHGPEAVIDEDTLIVGFLSREPYPRLYEIDLLRELREKKLGKAVLVCCDRTDETLEGLCDYAVEYDPGGRAELPDSVTPPVQVITGQLLGLFTSMRLGLKPDEPSESGVISRVVRGVKVYDREHFLNTSAIRIVAQR